MLDFIVIAGVYRCGLCQSQTAYDSAVDSVFDALDKVEEVLSTRRCCLEQCYGEELCNSTRVVQIYSGQQPHHDAGHPVDDDAISV